MKHAACNFCRLCEINLCMTRVLVRVLFIYHLMVLFQWTGRTDLFTRCPFFPFWVLIRFASSFIHPFLRSFVPSLDHRRAFTFRNDVFSSPSLAAHVLAQRKPVKCGGCCHSHFIQCLAKLCIKRQDEMCKRLAFLVFFIHRSRWPFYRNLFHVFIILHALMRFTFSVSLTWH